MRYFTHRNKAGKDLIYGTQHQGNGMISILRAKMLLTHAVLDGNSEPVLINSTGIEVNPVYGRKWQEITEERAKELLGGGAK